MGTFEGNNFKIKILKFMNLAFKMHYLLKNSPNHILKSVQLLLVYFKQIRLILNIFQHILKCISCTQSVKNAIYRVVFTSVDACPQRVQL